MRIHPWPLVGLLLAACVNDSKPQDDPIVVVETDGGDTTDGGDHDGETDALGGGVDDGADDEVADASDATVGDLGPDAFGGPWPVDDCEDACQRYVD